MLVALVAVEAAPFFDAIYDAINGNGRRSYGYSGYGNYGYNYGYNNGYNNGYSGYKHVERPPRQGKTFKEICRVHYPDAAAFPGAGGIVCPY
ncbi:unnamed protein product [Danaus chrysippus]|uniref:(African queen) hypothetical protein n=1 Tax=Danaus chrysippus TaxID=151541 RepID=A0A8J2WBK6_9NEOP|nr:unnamed protein product [Danaus chrysippus]